MYTQLRNLLMYTTAIVLVVLGTVFSTVNSVDASSEASTFIVDMKFTRDVNTSNPLKLMREEYIEINFKLKEYDTLLTVGDTFTVTLPKELEVAKNSNGGSYTAETSIKDDSINKDIADILYTVNKNQVELKVVNLYSYNDKGAKDEITARKFSTLHTGLVLGVMLTDDVDKLEFTQSETKKESNNTNVVVDNTNKELISTNPLSMQMQAEAPMMFAAITGGIELTIPDINPIGTIKLEAETKTITTGFTGDIEITDTRSSDTGWRLDVTASKFKVATPVGGFVGSTTAYVLPAGSLYLSPVQMIKNRDTGSEVLLGDTLASKSILDDGVITVTKAVAGKGVGEFNVEFDTNALSLVLDPSTARLDRTNYPSGGTPYETTITWTLVSAP